MAIKRADFPLPDVDDPLTREFFEGAARGELMIRGASSAGDSSGTRRPSARVVRGSRGGFR